MVPLKWTSNTQSALGASGRRWILFGAGYPVWRWMCLFGAGFDWAHIFLETIVFLALDVLLVVRALDWAHVLLAMVVAFRRCTCLVGCSLRLGTCPAAAVPFWRWMRLFPFIYACKRIAGRELCLYFSEHFSARYLPCSALDVEVVSDVHVNIHRRIPPSSCTALHVLFGAVCCKIEAFRRWMSCFLALDVPIGAEFNIQCRPEALRALWALPIAA